MKTTELYLEQVLIGFLILGIAAMPWAGYLWNHPEGIKTGIGIIGGSAALGLAFLIGIPFDRLSDTLCERLDQRNRLDFALKRAKWPLSGEKNGKLDPDLYPEDEHLIRCRRDKSNVGTLAYLRSRIRLARALAVYGPAMTVIATLAVPHWQAKEKEIEALTLCWWFGLLAGAYLVWTFLILFAAPKLYRTDDLETRDIYAKPWLTIQGNVTIYKKTELRTWRDELWSWIIPAMLLLASVAIGLASGCDNPAILLVALSGTILTLLSAWSWWRMTGTYRIFLLDCSRFADHKVPSTI